MPVKIDCIYSPSMDTKLETANTLTHGAGLAAAIPFSAACVIKASRGGSVLAIVSAAIFGASMILLYLASTLYHAARDEKKKRRLKVFDHSAIYVLIAGTYTPFLLVGLKGAWGWSLFGVIWGLAMAGIAFKLFFTGKFKKLSTFMYIGMGWLVVIAVGPLVKRLQPVSLWWLFAGGVAYTAGTIFYLNRKLRYAHAIWHGFVVLGTVSHAIAAYSLM